MSRIAAPELEDHPAFPVVLRDAMTAYLRVASEALGVSGVAAPLVLEAMDSIGSNHIVDLCSGGGGPVLSLVERLRRKHGREATATLTDKFPNAVAFARAESEFPGFVSGRRESTDATAVPEELVGVRTIFNAFHHLPPEIATAVLADAARKRQPILTFEIVERSWQGAVISLGTPASVYAFTPFIRPVSASTLALTYLVPVLPLLVGWDGFASCLRAYSVPELETMVAPLRRADYHFRVERTLLPMRPGFVTSVIGTPLPRGPRAVRR
jgi:hypothetical protein